MKKFIVRKDDIDICCFDTEFEASKKAEELNGEIIESGEDNKEDISRFDETCSELFAKYSEFRSRIKELECDGLIKTVTGKFLIISEYGYLNSDHLDLELIYIHVDSAFIDTREDSLYMNGQVIRSSTGDIDECCYFDGSCNTQIHISLSGPKNNLPNYIQEISREEFLEQAIRGMEQFKKDLENEFRKDSEETL